MLTNTVILAKLDERLKKFSSCIDGATKDYKESVQRTLQALDSPHSYYVILSIEELEKVRLDWMALAHKLGKQRASKRKVQLLPDRVEEFFGGANFLPHRPFATDDYTQGCRRHSWDDAQHLRSIEINPPAQVHWIILDCDHPDFERWKKAQVPEPSFITVNPENQHHHVVYRLSFPVCRTEKGRSRPKQYLSAIQEGLRNALGGDVNYVGLLTKNPLHSGWKTIRPDNMPAYTLDQLAATLDMRTLGRPKAASGELRPLSNLTEVAIGGRNKALFDALRQLAYKNKYDLSSLVQIAEQFNKLFPVPLALSEVQGVARSIFRFEGNNGGRARNSDAEFSRKQSLRGKKGGRPRTTLGTRPWEKTGISRSKWYAEEAKARHHPVGVGTQSCPVRQGRPPTTKNSQPWVALKISRATWYRQQRCSTQ